MQIRIQFLIAHAEADPGSKTNRDPWDPDPVQTISHKELNFYMKNILEVGNRSKNMASKVQRPF
jgi:hypothetical protein